MNWIKIGGYLLAIIPALITGILLGFYLLQEYLIFLGEKLPEKYQFQFPLAFRELNFEAPDGHVLNAVLFTNDGSKGLVYYHHGNAGNIQGWGKLAAGFIGKGFDVLFYDYRGYGKSSHSIRSEQQLHNDALFILQEIKRQFRYDKIIYYGTSLGSGVASRLAMTNRPTALILETPYYSFTDLVKYLHPYLPANRLSKYKLKNYKYLASVECPVLLFHGTRDEIVPYDSSERLMRIVKNGNLVAIRNGLHNNLPDFALYHSALKNFLNQL